ncbi:MAG: transcriptional regulator [Luteitalea sp.]|nr:transcriptional regulator [Luteitalea sp.]
MTDEQLEQLLTEIESDRVERKQSLSDPDKIHEAICAFANDMPGHAKPGVLFIGVRNDGSCAGEPITDKLLISLAQMRDDGTILPLPSMIVQKRVIVGCELAVAIVQPSRTLPVRYRGRVCIRVGPRRATATGDEERQLVERQRGFNLPFDARETVGATLSDLDVGYLRDEYLPAAIDPDVLAENRRPIEHQLRAIHFQGPGGSPTYAGLLVAGIDSTAWMPGAYVQFVRFAGTELSDSVRDEKLLSGRLADVLRGVDDVIKAHNEVTVDFTSHETEVRVPAYPLAALQQIIRNAVMHRNYEGTGAPVRVYWFDDRIEVHSPGGPYGQVTAENFGEPYVSDYRNPLIAEAMRTLGFVQRFGVGIAIARRELEKNGNPPLEFDVQPTAVLATLRRRP